MSATTESVHLLDVVALREDQPPAKLRRGQVGTVIEVLADGVYEVEFVDNQGHTYGLATLRADQLMVLHFAPHAAAR